MKKLIVSFVGRGGVGKTSAATHLQDKYGFTVFTFSSVIREYAASHNLPLQKRADYASVHAEILKKFGWDYTLTVALGLQADLLCIDDVRSPRFAEYLRQAGGKEIAFECSTKQRFAHVREHPDRVKYPATLTEFIQNEREDEAAIIGPGLEFDVDSLLQGADYHIDASQSLNHALRQLDSIIDSLLDR